MVPQAFTISLRFEPFITDENRFYVYCENVLVASIIKVANGYAPESASTAVYASPLLAAFADANLSNPAAWRATNLANVS
jgi:hypothetical protein